MKDRLITFLTEAKRKTYASGENAIKETQADGSIIMRYVSTPMVYKDHYYGGEPYIGEEILFHKDQAVWGMNYTGRLTGNGVNMRDAVYGFLQEALSQPHNDAPLRGPQKYSQGGFTYTAHNQGTTEFFNGYEEILSNTETVYKGYYHGGTINIT